jgi:hypothetical protein
VKQALADEFVDLIARLKGRIQLQRRVMPPPSLVEIALDMLSDPLVLDLQKRLGVAPVVPDELVPQRENLQTAIAPPRIRILVERRAPAGGGRGNQAARNLDARPLA